MGAALALLSALCFGTADFAAGLASRRFAAGPVTTVAQGLALLTVLMAALAGGAVDVQVAALWWGALAGVGSGIGTLALYQGLAVGRMSVVATLSAVLGAVIPVCVGVALGNHLAALTVVGIVLAVAAIGLVCAQPSDRVRTDRGVAYGLLAGLALALLLVALDRAGTNSGAWPLVPDQAVALLLAAPFAVVAIRRGARADAGVWGLIVPAGLLAGGANLLFLSSTGHGELAVISVLASLYPAVTVILARLLLSEYWSARQRYGLLAAAVAVVLVGLG